MTFPKVEVYGPWSAPGPAECGVCEVITDPAGHRMFTTLCFLCPQHAERVQPEAVA